MSRATLHCGDVRTVLSTLPAESVQCVVTSPPYWGLRDYGVQGQLGLEGTPGEYVEAMVSVFREVRRVLRNDGVVFLNLGDSYASSAACERRNVVGNGSPEASVRRPDRRSGDLKNKDLVGIPWAVAFALRADGWWLRSDVIWAKPNPMPESVTDRPTRSHEYLFLLTKSERYYYDAAAIAETAIGGWNGSEFDDPRDLHPNVGRKPRESVPRGSFNGKTEAMAEEGRNAFRAVTSTRNARSVWTIATMPYPAAHFATFPEELARRCILAGSSPRACEHCGAPWERVTERESVALKPNSQSNRGNDPSSRRGIGQPQRGSMAVDVTTIGWQPTCSCENTGTGRSIVLDPFGGSGTVAQVATGNGRDSVYIDLNPAYRELARQRIGPMLCEDAA